MAKSFVNQKQLAQIAPAAIGRGANGFAHGAWQILVVKIGINVVTAGQQHTVRAADNFSEHPPVSRRWRGDGDATGLKHGMVVFDRKADGKVMKFGTPFFDAR